MDRVQQASENEERDFMEDRRYLVIGAAGICFNVAPGLVTTPMARRITENEHALKASTAMHPLGRIGQPEEGARAIAFLLGAESAWTTGQVLGVDGGLARLKGC
jgi:NAD(P)-dependent dehydrogenase (short-subunit alcohol dehydrogenase family)